MTSQSIEHKMREWVESTQLIPLGSRILIACSGGRDSLALMHLLHLNRKRWQCTLSVVYVDHGLRDVAHEAQLVREQASSLGLKFSLLKVEVPEKGPSLQAKAREVRLQALSSEAARMGADLIAMGHTLSDQSETLLFRLARGSGLRGMGGIRPRRDLFIRPLLSISREETGRYLETVGCKWIDDPSNDDLRFSRVEVRKEWIPMMERSFPGVSHRIASAAISFQEALDFMERHGGKALSDCLLDARTGVLKLSGAKLKKVDRRLLPLVIQKAMERVGTEQISRAHVEALMEMLKESRGTRELHLAGVKVTQVYDEVIFVGAGYEEVPSTGFSKDFAEGVEEIPGPGCYGCGDWLLTIERVNPPDTVSGSTPHEVFFQGDQLSFPLTLRKVQKGERIRPFGMTGSKLVSDILTDKKVPRDQRAESVVLTNGSVVLWLLGQARSNEAPVEGKAEWVWRMSCEPRERK